MSCSTRCYICRKTSTSLKAKYWIPVVWFLILFLICFDTCLCGNMQKFEHSEYLQLAKGQDSFWVFCNRVLSTVNKIWHLHIKNKLPRAKYWIHVIWIFISLFISLNACLCSNMHKTWHSLYLQSAKRPRPILNLNVIKWGVLQSHVQLDATFAEKRQCH